MMTNVNLPTAPESQQEFWTVIDIHSVFHRAAREYSQQYPQGGAVYRRFASSEHDLQPGVSRETPENQLPVVGESQHRAVNPVTRHSRKALNTPRLQLPIHIVIHSVIHYLQYLPKVIRGRKR
jgi:hypothetical protein